jgi:hypothetical protein
VVTSMIEHFSKPNNISSAQSSSFCSRTYPFLLLHFETDTHEWKTFVENRYGTLEASSGKAPRDRS